MARAAVTFARADAGDRDDILLIQAFDRRPR